MVIADLFIMVANSGRVAMGYDQNNWGSQCSKVTLGASSGLGCKEAFVKEVVPRVDRPCRRQVGDRGVWSMESSPCVMNSVGPLSPGSSNYWI